MFNVSMNSTPSWERFQATFWNKVSCVEVTVLWLTDVAGSAYTLDVRPAACGRLQADGLALSIPEHCTIKAGLLQLNGKTMNVGMVLTTWSVRCDAVWGSVQHHVGRMNFFHKK